MKHFFQGMQLGSSTCGIQIFVCLYLKTEFLTTIIPYLPTKTSPSIHHFLSLTSGGVSHQLLLISILSYIHLSILIGKIPPSVGSSYHIFTRSACLCVSPLNLSHTSQSDQSPFFTIFKIHSTSRV